ncbi:MAG: hypothetical protein VCC04_04255 [Myxococcota bacterium]
MEASILGKLLTALLLLGALVYLSFLRPWRPQRLWERRTPAVDLLFVAALAMGLAALHAEAPFPQAARRVVEMTELPETLWEVDLEIQLLRQWPEQRWNELTTRLGWDDPEPLEEGLAAEEAWISNAVLPSVIAVVEVLLRGMVYWGSLMVMVVCQAIRLAVGLTRAIRNHGARGAEVAIDSQIARLEQKIATLETRLEARPSPT